MKTTLEIPDVLFRRAKAYAAQQGIPFRALVADALSDKLRTTGTQSKPWLRSFGKLRHLREETALIQRRIEEEFGGLEPEDRQ